MSRMLMKELSLACVSRSSKLEPHSEMKSVAKEAVVPMASSTRRRSSGSGAAIVDFLCASLKILGFKFANCEEGEVG